MGDKKGFGLAPIKDEGGVASYGAGSKYDPEKSALFYLNLAKGHIEDAINVNCGFSDLRVFNSVHDALSTLMACTTEIESQLEKKKHER